MEYEEYHAEDHLVDEYPSGEINQEEEEQGPIAGFIDSIKTIESDIRAKLTAATEQEEDVNMIENNEEQEEEEQGFFQKLTGFEISSPFSQPEEDEEEVHTNHKQQTPVEEKSEEKSIFDRLTRFDGKKEEGYNVLKSSTVQDDAELKDAPKVSNMVALFEKMQGKKSQVVTSTGKSVAEDEIAQEKKRDKEKRNSREEPGLLEKLSTFSFTSSEEKEQEPDPEVEESKGLIERLRGFSFDTNSPTNEEEPETYNEVDEASESSFFDQVATSIKNTFTIEEEGSIEERITDED